jgi:hypothetical protein
MMDAYEHDRGGVAVGNMALDQLSTRIERVEKIQRRVLRFGLAIVVCSIAFVLLGFAKSQYGTIDGRAFVLHDDSGRIRARLDLERGLAGIALYDKHGEARTELSLAPDDSPAQCFYDDGGQGRIMIQKGIGDSWSLAFYRHNGTEAIRLGVDFEGSPYLYFMDKDGKRSWSTVPPKS